MKGHGLASFNLAVFFHKGIGGLPVDPGIAKELLAEAAEKNVPEVFSFILIILIRFSLALKLDFLKLCLYFTLVFILIYCCG